MVYITRNTQCVISHPKQCELILSLMLNYFNFSHSVHSNITFIIHVSTLFFKKKLVNVLIKTKIYVNSLRLHKSVQHIYKADYNYNSIGLCLHMNIINVR